YRAFLVRADLLLGRRSPTDCGTDPAPRRTGSYQESAAARTRVGAARVGRARPTLRSVARARRCGGTPRVSHFVNIPGELEKGTIRDEDAVSPTSCLHWRPGWRGCWSVGSSTLPHLHV